MMPSPLVAAYSRMLPVLEAEESLLAFKRVAVGSGTMKRGAREQIIRSWGKTARSGATPVRRAKGPAEFSAMMRGLGVGVRRG